MKKIYRSKIDRVVLLPVAALLFAAFIYCLVVGNFLISVLIFLAGLFLFYVCRSTFYQLTTDNKLKVRSGFLFNREIHVNSIRRIRSARGHSASPALSQDRLEIFYHRYGSVLVSPVHSKEFIADLKKINPRISVE